MAPSEADDSKTSPGASLSHAVGYDSSSSERRNEYGPFSMGFSDGRAGKIALFAKLRIVLDVVGRQIQRNKTIWHDGRVDRVIMRETNVKQEVEAPVCRQNTNIADGYS